MTDGTINWDELAKQAAAAFDPIPTGEYAGTVTEASAVSASNGKPMIKVKVKINGGPHDGRLVFNNFVISADNPNAMGFFFRHMKALGLDANFFAQQPSMPQVAEQLTGRQALWGLGIRQYQGQDQNEIKTIKPLVGLPGMPAGAPAGGAPAGLPSAPGAVPASSAPGIPAGAPVAAGGLPGGIPAGQPISGGQTAAPEEPF